MKITKAQVTKTLKTIMDPEMHISIVDLGLVYKITVSKNAVHILMTLTSIGCPLFPTIAEDVKINLEKLGFKRKNIELELVFNPPWSPDKMSKQAKATLGM